MKHKPKSIILTTLVMGGLLICSEAAVSDIGIGGYFKSFSVVLDPTEPSSIPESFKLPPLGMVSNRVRLDISARLSSRLSFKLAYDLSPKIQDPFFFGQSSVAPVGSDHSDDLMRLVDFEALPYRVTDLDEMIYPSDDSLAGSFAVYQNLDRAQVTLKSDIADFYIGRQAIAWGNARVVNPTDILAPYAFNELDVEDRGGIDAFRVRIPVGLMSEIDGGIAFGDELAIEQSAIFLRSKFRWGGHDFSFLMIDFRQNLLAGFDLARSLGGAGVWLEAAQVFVDAFEPNDTSGGSNYLRVSLGADYFLRNGTYLFAEYHFNQAGADQASEYIDRQDQTAYREGNVYLLGRHYLAPGISYPITPLLSATGEALVNLTDPSLFFMARFEYNMAEDIFIETGVFIGLGDRMTLNLSQPGRRPVQMASEFGSYPDMFYGAFRAYF